MILGFHRPRTVAEALRLRAELGDGVAWLGGGGELNQPRPGCSPEHLVSLDALGLDRVLAVPGAVEIGATCTLQRVLDAPQVPAALREAIGHVQNRNARNLATIGGHLSTSRPTAAAVPALGALEAVVVVADPGGAPVDVPVLDHAGGPRTALVLAVRVPLPPPGRRLRVARFAHTANDVSVATVAVALDRDGDAVRRARIVAGGVDLRPVRLETLERAIEGRPLPDTGVRVDEVEAQVHPRDDLTGSAAWKRRILAVLVVRALAAAWHDAEVV